MNLLKSHVLHARSLRRALDLVVILAQETSDGMPCSPQVFDVKVHVLDATCRARVHHLQLDRTQSDPPASLGARHFRREVISPRMLCMCPGSCNVQVREVDVLAESAQFARRGLHAEQCIFSALPTRYVYQNMLPWHHQIEPVTMNILQVGVANGRGSASGCCIKEGDRIGVRVRSISRILHAVTPTVTQVYIIKCLAIHAPVALRVTS
mmetsp:Transcript_57830/g.155980  ORF Transcript_57830/g.155980 Transcript_57830/m.155980 type:complete len:209 (-) Transcript_57830:610-1236(-)